MKTMFNDSPKRVLTMQLPLSMKNVSFKKLMWWIIPTIVLVPIIYFSGDLISPIAAYIGTSSLWNVITKISNRV
jgi:hypothetical protein